MNVGRATILAIAFSCASLLAAPQAFAAKEPVESGALDFRSICTSGTYHGVAQGRTSNGNLLMSNCRDSKGRLTTVGVQYRKDGGNTISAQFGWQFSNADGTSVLNGDTGATFTQEPHHDKHQIFYYTGLVFPKGYPCVRGVLYSGGNTYVTKTEC